MPSWPGGRIAANVGGGGFEAAEKLHVSSQRPARHLRISTATATARTSAHRDGWWDRRGGRGPVKGDSRRRRRCCYCLVAPLRPAPAAPPPVAARMSWHSLRGRMAGVVLVCATPSGHSSFHGAVGSDAHSAGGWSARETVHLHPIRRHDASPRRATCIAEAILRPRLAPLASIHRYVARACGFAGRYVVTMAEKRPLCTRNGRAWRVAAVPRAWLAASKPSFLPSRALPPRCASRRPVPASHARPCSRRGARHDPLDPRSDTGVRDIMLPTAAPWLLDTRSYISRTPASDRRILLEDVRRRDPPRGPSVAGGLPVSASLRRR